MLNDNAKKWVAALRSGEYAQGNGRLHTRADDGDQFCCLGVACDLYVKDGNTIPVEDISFLSRPAVSYDGSYFYLPALVGDWLGLADTRGVFLSTSSGVRTTRSLAKLNDEDTPFAQIADIIESEPEGLFVAS